MLDLILMRHSKAVTASPAGDRARALSPRGIAEAAEAGRALASHAVPDLALVSDARRTRETFDRLVESFGRPIAHRFEPVLYGATPHGILDAIAATPDACRRLLVVGHNPGIGELARRLAKPQASDRTTAMDSHFPTSAFALLRFDVEIWRAIEVGGRLEAYVVPQGWQAGR